MSKPFKILIISVSWITGSASKPDASVTTGSPWTGDMHPKIGFPAGCNLTIGGDCSPSYEDLDNKGALWKCPLGNDKKDWPVCEQGSGSNPLCQDLSASKPCCCPLDGCYVDPVFNPVIGVCKGADCACGAERTTAPSCAPQGQSGKCDGKCTGDSVACCFGNDVSELVHWWDDGSEVVLNYLAAYQYDENSERWMIQEESSFNTDGSRPAYDLMKPYGGIGQDKAWLAPQPGGSAFWGLGYYPAGVQGVGVPGAMFVMSTEQFWGATWYMLNQIELDRGPAAQYPADKCEITNSNCWAAGNAGEMDFLETPWNAPASATVDSFRRSFSTQWNQVGRKFNGGHNGGGFGSNNYLLTAEQGSSGKSPVIYVAVVDSVGNFVYRIPADKANEIWPGIGRKTINATLQAAPASRPSMVNPCRGDVSEDFCYVFTSNCQASNYADATAENCGFNGNQGFCGNWMAQMANTKQPLFPDENCTRDTRGGKTMPWCIDMLGNSA